MHVKLTDGDSMPYTSLAGVRDGFERSNRMVSPPAACLTTCT